MSIEPACRQPAPTAQRETVLHAARALLPCALLALALAGCASAGGNPGGVVIQPLDQAHYAPTQTVDVLGVEPARPHIALARLTLSDPTGSATLSQLTAQLVEAARQLGADALVLAPVARSTAAGVGFNPAGGQMQDSQAGSALSISAQAIRYTP